MEYREKGVFKKKVEGVCICEKEVFSNQLFVEEEEKLYHFTCYNQMKKNSNSE